MKIKWICLVLCTELMIFGKSWAKLIFTPDGDNWLLDRRTDSYDQNSVEDVTGNSYCQGQMKCSSECLTSIDRYEQVNCVIKCNMGDPCACPKGYLLKRQCVRVATMNFCWERLVSCDIKHNDIGN